MLPKMFFLPFLTAVLFQQSLLSQAEAASSKVNGADDLAALCLGKKINLVSIKQIGLLVEKLADKDNKPPCSLRIEEALRKMHELHEVITTSNLCSMKSVELIKAYVEIFLRPSDDEAQLPKSLEDFIIAFGMQVSNYCKVDMMRILFERGLELMKQGDFAEFDEYCGVSTPIGRLTEALNKPGDILLPTDLMAILPNNMLFEKLFVMLPGDKTARVPRIKEMCSKRFKPIYRPVVMPLAALARAGFDYPDSVLRIDLEETPVLIEGIATWSRVIFLCEAVELIEIVPAPKPKIGERPRAKPEFEVRFLSSEEVKNLHDNPIQYDNIEDIEQIPYEHKCKAQLENTIVTNYDKKLKILMKAYKSSESESDRLRDKFVKKSWSLLRENLKYGEGTQTIKLVYKKLSKKNSKKTADGEGDKSLDKEQESINAALVGLMDDKKKSKTFYLFSRFNNSVKRTSRLITAIVVTLVLRALNSMGL